MVHRRVGRPLLIVTQPAILQTSGSVWIDGEITTAPGVDLEMVSNGHPVVRGRLRAGPGTGARPAGKVRLVAGGQLEVAGTVTAGRARDGQDKDGEGYPMPVKGDPGGAGGDVDLRA